MLDWTEVLQEEVRSVWVDPQEAPDQQLSPAELQERGRVTLEVFSGNKDTEETLEGSFKAAHIPSVFILIPHL